MEPNLPRRPPRELTREVLAQACDRAIRLCRAWGCGEIVLEKGLGKLRSVGRNKSLNGLLNGWARTTFEAMLRRKAGLAGIAVRLVWGGYSTTIGNLAFEAPDACASACEIARRGLAAAGGSKELLPACPYEVVSGLWKDRGLPIADLPRRTGGWGDVHRRIKAAGLGVRRPHPATPGSEGRGPSDPGLAVRRLGRGRGRVHRPAIRPGRREKPVARERVDPRSQAAPAKCG